MRNACATNAASKASTIGSNQHSMSCRAVTFSPAVEEWLFTAVDEMPPVQRTLCRPTPRCRDDQVAAFQKIPITVDKRLRAHLMAFNRKMRKRLLKFCCQFQCFVLADRISTKFVTAKIGPVQILWIDKVAIADASANKFGGHR